MDTANNMVITCEDRYTFQELAESSVANCNSPEVIIKTRDVYSRRTMKHVGLYAKEAREVARLMELIPEHEARALMFPFLNSSASRVESLTQH